MPFSQLRVDRLNIRFADLSHGAFKALTGGRLDPPGQIDISWYDTLVAWADVKIDLKGTSAMPKANVKVRCGAIVIGKDVKLR